MAWNKDKEITMDILPDFDHILEEGKNTSVNLRRVSWNGRDHKIDIRKWSYSDDGEKAMKGIQLTDEGAGELANVLVEVGFGETKRLIKAIQKREDYDDSFKAKIVDDTDDGSEDYYDPSELLGEY